MADLGRGVLEGDEDAVCSVGGLLEKDCGVGIGGVERGRGYGRCLGGGG